MRLILAALAFACASCSAAPAAAPVPAAAAPQCVPVAAFERMAAQRHLPLALVEPVGPFLTALNAMPPPSHLQADQILVMRAGNAARLLLARSGCMVTVVEIGWEDFLRLAGQSA